MNPNEIFTYPVENKSDEGKKTIKAYHCRFLNKRCTKQSRIIKYPMGVCSVNHSNTKPIICPHRFLENNIVFHNVCKEAFGDVNNILLFSEVKIKNIGSFDFVLVKHKPISNKVDNFCVVELQSDSTTGTGKLIEALNDFMKGKNVLENKYPFGMNTYNTIKLSYIQMLIKGRIMEKWRKNIFWVMQKFVYENMIKRFQLTNLDHNTNHSTQYHIYDLIKRNELYTLKLTQVKSTTITNLLKAFTHQPSANIDDFIEILERKIKLKVGLSIK